MLYEEFDTVTTIGDNDDAEVTVQYELDGECDPSGARMIVTAHVVNVLVYEADTYVPLPEEVVAELKSNGTWEQLEDAAQDHASS